MEIKAFHILGTTFLFFVLLIVSGCSHIFPLASKPHPNHREKVLEKTTEILPPQNSLECNQQNENNPSSETMKISDPEASLNALESYPQTIDQRFFSCRR